MTSRSQPQSQDKSTKVLGFKFIVAEDEYICHNYVYITQNCINGSQQQGNTMCENIFQKHHEQTMNIDSRDSAGL